MDCGDGNLDHQNFIRSQESLTASSVSAKTTTAHSSLVGTAEFTVSSMAKRSCIRSPEEWARSAADACFVIAMAVCGLELSTRGLCMYTREGQMYLDSHRASQAKRRGYFLRIEKEVFGWQLGMVSIAFAASLFPRFQ